MLRVNRVSGWASGESFGGWQDPEGHILLAALGEPAGRGDADHVVFFLSDLVDHLDLTAITTPYKQESRGYPPYHPRMMVKLLLYSYASQSCSAGGSNSSRSGS